MSTETASQRDDRRRRELRDQRAANRVSADPVVRDRQQRLDDQWCRSALASRLSGGQR